jgi:hypothetical protein
MTMHGKPCLRLLAMAALSFIAMYILMYAMVDRLANVLPNLDQAYMAGLMTAPMVTIELLVMRPMYERGALSVAILVASVAMLAVCWFAIRDQTAIARSAGRDRADEDPAGQGRIGRITGGEHAGCDRQCPLHGP